MRKLYPETFLVALAVILLEISYTRVFSYKLVYYFTYVVIGISLLGLGAGGVFVAVFERLRRMEPEKLLVRCCLGAAVLVLIGYFVVAELPLNLFRMVRGDAGVLFAEGAKLAVVIAFLFAPFLAGGIALSIIFSTQTERIGRLYFVDLIGAAFGCIIIIPAISWISPPGAVLLAGLAFALAGLRLARLEGPTWLRATAGVAFLALLGVLFPGLLPDPVRDRIKGTDQATPLFSRWSPVFRVDVVPVPGVTPAVNFLIHDGTLGSSMIQWDGDPGSLTRYETMDRSYPFRLLRPKPRVAIIGSAGGNEILASLRLGAGKITGIELNPVTVSLLTDHFAEFTGHLTKDSRVRVVNAEGRSFLKSSGEEFDLIWLVAPDSYAAMNAATSGAFVLSESYLYTREMIVEAIEHLDPDGILCAQFGELDFDVKPNRVVRYLGTAREAFAELGIDDFKGHVAVAVAPGFGRLNSSTILLKKSPFTPADLDALKKAVATVPDAKLVYAGDTRDPSGMVAKTIELEGDELERFYEEHPYRVRPISDDSPFFWHFVGFDTLLGGESGQERMNVEEGVGERLLLVLLAFATLFAAVFLLLPLVAIRDVWRAIPYKLESGLYFASLGLGFMFLEVALIQKLTLFLGYPTYSLTVTLFAILVSTGIGSLLSERYAAQRNRAFQALLGALVVLFVVYQLVLAPIIHEGVGWPFSIRVALTVLFLMPLGLVLGAFMPLGLRSVAAVTPHRQEYVAWCWAVNGFFSVVASVLSTILSMTIGFRMVMLVGLVIYVLGVSAFRRLPEPGPLTA
jgi:spermidine synthase